MRGHPAVTKHPAEVVVDGGDKCVAFLARVAEDADHLVAVAVEITVDVAVTRCDLADLVCPAWPRHAAVHQLERGLLGLRGLAGGAEARDAGEQRERRRAVLAGGIGDEALAHEFLDVRSAPAARPVLQPLPPPGAENLAHHELGVQRAAHREQLARCPEHLGEQRVRRRIHVGRLVTCPSIARATAGTTVWALATWGFATALAHTEFLVSLSARVPRLPTGPVHPRRPGHTPSAHRGGPGYGPSLSDSRTATPSLRGRFAPTSYVFVPR